MTIDEYIKHAREKESCPGCNHEQVIEWLEELKEYKSGEHDRKVRTAALQAFVDYLTVWAEGNSSESLVDKIWMIIQG